MAGKLSLHPLYDVEGLRHKNVKEFYDYDIALVKVQKSIPISQKVRWGLIERICIYNLSTLLLVNACVCVYVFDRPICLPCTKPASSALRMNPDSTCKQHCKT